MVGAVASRSGAGDARAASAARASAGAGAGEAAGRRGAPAQRAASPVGADRAGGEPFGAPLGMPVVQPLVRGAGGLGGIGIAHQGARLTDQPAKLGLARARDAGRRGDQHLTRRARKEGEVLAQQPPSLGHMPVAGRVRVIDGRDGLLLLGDGGARSTRSVKPSDGRGRLGGPAEPPPGSPDTGGASAGPAQAGGAPTRGPRREPPRQPSGGGGRFRPPGGA
jgi:hypothetical protein